MIEIYDTKDFVNDPDWKHDAITVEFNFRNGITKVIKIDTFGMTTEEIQDIRGQILGKRKLLQSIFEHDTHGQITVQGLTVRADDLIAVSIR